MLSRASGWEGLVRLDRRGRPLCPPMPTPPVLSWRNQRVVLPKDGSGEQLWWSLRHREQTDRQTAQKGGWEGRKVSAACVIPGAAGRSGAGTANAVKEPKARGSSLL